MWSHSTIKRYVKQTFCLLKRENDRRRVGKILEVYGISIHPATRALAVYLNNILSEQHDIGFVSNRMLFACPLSHGLWFTNLHASVVKLPVPVRIPSQRPRVSHQSRLSADDKGGAYSVELLFRGWKLLIFIFIASYFFSNLKFVHLFWLFSQRNFVR